ncbi:helix-turn-helix transcriptional regulator [Hymenobacter sp. BT186]|uniref:Helix-turn-helix transcriptional regulator n=1 Tax=Hymenobacter telluris TaxID=2816474 RepID=A0A939JBG7_9BACT|nr:helix-turn-helix transcriptional regulator [Hymenobacter telluris]MBO0356773.1 helix-turn-helix transcriptional regulator [Hymenobacter telluris]MBW3372799.1 helix-turn-helix transcriptional regulator [Hymenobacter norwichensis]
MTTTTLTDLYQELAPCTGLDLSALLPVGIQREVGHFNVFDLTDLWDSTQLQPATPYPCRSFYKISLLRSRSRTEYARQTIAIEPDALVFSTPKVPFQWLPDEPQRGYFCLFTAEFLLPVLGGLTPDELPLFQADGYPVFQLTPAEAAQAETIFAKMHGELPSDYAHKYDLLRAYVLELLHLGQKRQPTTTLHPAHSAAARLSSRFVELLERQFPLTTPQQRVPLRTAKAFADHLAVHVNHLNKVLKDSTGRTTTDLIGGRLAQEAKVLLRQTDWTLWEIADSLGFVDVAHFSHFFRRYAPISPGAFRTLDTVPV